MTEQEQKINCSVPILTLNSEKHLEGCLDSIKDFDNVFLVDGNSTDNTLEIAEKLGIRVYKQVETDESNVRISNFAAMRDKATSFGRHEWVLVLDSDEYLSPELIEEIRSTLQKNPDKKKAFKIPFWPIIEGKIIKYSFAQKVPYIRLYNKEGGICWNQSKVVHEKFSIPEDVEVVEMKNYFYGYSPDYKKCIEKDNHYLSLAKRKFLSKKNKRGNKVILLRACVKNLARAFKIILVSTGIYIKHGFSNSLPPKQVWRYVRYHLIISYYRLRQLL